MKKIILSAAVAAMALSTSAFAADKGIDIVTTGQAVVYYNSAAASGGAGSSQDLFSPSGDDNTKANVGVQLNLDADLKNGFTFGSQINYLGTLGLEKTAVAGTMQNVDNNITQENIADDIYISKIFIAKQIANTTVKLGRQELPKSLSPFAFSEGWNVFKNTFDSALVVNTDIPDTTLVGAYVSKTNGNGFGNNMSSYGDLSFNNGALSGVSDVRAEGEAFMLTVQNKSLPMTTVTATYYDIANIDSNSSDATVHGDLEGASVVWGNAAIAGKDLPMGLKVGLQGGTIMTESSGLSDTTAYGIKAGLKPIKALSLCAAYTSVDDGDVHIQNTGGVKTPLYTQMIANQGAIKSDNDTFMLKAIYNTGDYGKVILQGTQTTDNSDAKSDVTDLELVYKVKAGGVDFLAAYINQTWDAASGANDTLDIVRVVARYNF